MHKRPLLIVVSAPSGAGKTTLCDRLLAERTDITYSVSCTTRPPRGLEKDGEDYHFLTDRQFAQRIGQDAFLEHALVHGYRYGTLRKTVQDALQSGRSVLMDLDVQGAAQIRAVIAAANAGDPLKAAFMDIFIEPPSTETLRERLVKRGEDGPEVIERRIQNARTEMDHRHEFQHRIVNRDLDVAYRELKTIVEQATAAALPAGREAHES